MNLWSNKLEFQFKTVEYYLNKQFREYQGFPQHELLDGVMDDTSVVLEQEKTWFMPCSKHTSELRVSLK